MRKEIEKKGGKIIKVEKNMVDEVWEDKKEEKEEEVKIKKESFQGNEEKEKIREMKEEVEERGEREKVMKEK